MHKIAPCLWYDGAAREAASFYVSLLPDSRIGKIVTAPGDNPSSKAGEELVVEFTLAGQQFVALNGGPQFRFTEAVSFHIFTDDQAETDRLWNAITGDGGQESECGWCKDRWGMSWQITPRRMMDLLSDPDPGRTKRAFEAMMTMRKLDIAAIEAAADGTGLKGSGADA